MLLVHILAYCISPLQRSTVPVMPRLPACISREPACSGSPVVGLLCLLRRRRLPALHCGLAADHFDPLLLRMLSQRSATAVTIGELVLTYLPVGFLPTVLQLAWLPHIMRRICCCFTDSQPCQVPHITGAACCRWHLSAAFLCCHLLQRQPIADLGPTGSACLQHGVGHHILASCFAITCKQARLLMLPGVGTMQSML